MHPFFIWQKEPRGGLGGECGLAAARLKKKTRKGKRKLIKNLK